MVGSFEPSFRTMFVSAKFLLCTLSTSSKPDPLFIPATKSCVGGGKTAQINVDVVQSSVFNPLLWGLLDERKIDLIFFGLPLQTFFRTIL
jgi:hypothetical protein